MYELVFLIDILLFRHVYRIIYRFKIIRKKFESGIKGNRLIPKGGGGVMEGGIKYRSVEFQKSRHESDTSYDLRTNRGRNPVRSANRRRLSTGFRLSGEQSVDNHRRRTRSSTVAMKMAAEVRWLLAFLVSCFVPFSRGEMPHRKFEYKYSFKPPYLAQKDGSVPFWEYGGSKYTQCI